MRMRAWEVSASFFVERTAPGGPTDRTGRVRQGDLLATIDGKRVCGQDLQYIFKHILGPGV